MRWSAGIGISIKNHPLRGVVGEYSDGSCGKVEVNQCPILALMKRFWIGMHIALLHRRKTVARSKFRFAIKAVENRCPAPIRTTSRTNDFPDLVSFRETSIAVQSEKLHKELTRSRTIRPSTDAEADIEIDDIDIVPPLPRRSGVIKVTLQYAGRSKPISVDFPDSIEYADDGGER